MYDELIAALRFCDNGECDGCCKYIKGKGTECYTLLRDAADAIEELSKRVPPVPHGRLIDADAFEAFIRKDWDKNDHWIADVVYSRPTIIPAEEEEENFCAECHWFEEEKQYCFRNGCHAYDESTCEHWEPIPADEPIPAPGGKTAPTTYDLLYEEGGYNSNGV